MMINRENRLVTTARKIHKPTRPAGTAVKPSSEMTPFAIHDLVRSFQASVHQIKIAPTSAVNSSVTFIRDVRRDPGP
jgi:hypothetical protein